MLPEQYTFPGIYPDHDWDRLEAADQESTEVLQIYLQSAYLWLDGDGQTTKIIISRWVFAAV